jgi:hypothetical protein
VAERARLGLSQTDMKPPKNILGYDTAPKKTKILILSIQAGGWPQVTSEFPRFDVAKFPRHLGASGQTKQYRSYVWPLAQLTRITVALHVWQDRCQTCPKYVSFFSSKLPLGSSTQSNVHFREMLHVVSRYLPISSNHFCW